jgi:hypothetical protein
MFLTIYFFDRPATRFRSKKQYDYLVARVFHVAPLNQPDETQAPPPPSTPSLQQDAEVPLG